MLVRSKPIFTPQQKREIHAGAVGFNAGVRAAERRFEREANTLKMEAAKEKVTTTNNKKSATGRGRRPVLTEVG